MWEEYEEVYTFVEKMAGILQFKRMQHASLFLNLLNLAHIACPLHFVPLSDAADTTAVKASVCTFFPSCGACMLSPQSYSSPMISLMCNLHDEIIPHGHIYIYLV